MKNERDPESPDETLANHVGTDEFWLYDLRVEVVEKRDRPFVCNHKVGDYFLVEGENLVFKENQTFPMYALSAVLPFLPAKQRETDGNDWMTTDSEIACPDPHCGGRFCITRVGRRKFRHSETTGLPSLRGKPYWNRDDKT